MVDLTDKKYKDVNKLMLSEALEMINEDLTLLDKGNVFAFTANSPLHKVFTYAFNPEYKFLLPEGIPPYTSCEVSAGMQPTDLLVAIQRNRFVYFIDKNIPDAKREQLFITLLETIHPSEAKVMLAIKDQILSEMYPNITWDNLAKYGYLPQREVKEDDSVKKSLQKSSEVAQKAVQKSKVSLKRASRNSKKKSTTDNK